MNVDGWNVKSQNKEQVAFLFFLLEKKMLSLANTDPQCLLIWKQS